MLAGTATLPRLEVRCPVSDHLLCKAGTEQFGTTLAILCKCGRMVYGDHAHRLAVRDLRER
jgi:hypothetical protein